MIRRFFRSRLILFLIGTAFGALRGQAQTLQHEAGLMTMEPVRFYFQYGSYASRLELVSSEARIWYSFQVADRDPAEKPLFVFFNGGPGAATSSGLMSMCTARYMLDNRIDGGGDELIPNPSSWTRAGNLLYIDPRQTGFSYGVMENVDDAGARFREFNAQNFNSFFDAAEFVRVLLRFLARHAELRDNPVVIVGESYGGVRATVMLHLLLNYADYGNGREMYQDPSLVSEIQTHLDVVFPEYRGEVVPPHIISRQFGRQILIQPALSMGYQSEVTEEMWSRPDSVLVQIGDEVGIPYDGERYPDPYQFVEDVAGRDAYIYTKPVGWLNRFFTNAGRLLRFSRKLSLMTGTDVTQIRELHASSRSDAYRLFDPESEGGWMAAVGPAVDRRLFLMPARAEWWLTVLEPGDMESIFGLLQPWDRYFLSSNLEATRAFHFFNVARTRGFEVYYALPRFGRMFLKNAAEVETFVTHAALDLVVYSQALPPALARHTDVLMGVRHEWTLPEGTARPGRMVLEYRPDAFPDLPPVGVRTIRFPIYATSCHAVSLTQPEDLLQDVVLWLRETGLTRE